MVKSFISLIQSNIQEFIQVLTWKNQANNVATKLNKANALIFKKRHFVEIKTLKIDLSRNFLITSFLSFICLETKFVIRQKTVHSTDKITQTNDFLKEKY